MIVLAVGCTSNGGEEPHGPSAVPPTGCGPLTPARVAGTAPAYVDGEVDRFANDHAACAGVWLRAVAGGFVAQGVAVRGHAAWISGFDGGAREGRRWCTVVRTDLRTGHTLDHRVLRAAATVDGTHSCRHAGGVALEGHGLWLTEADGLWLLDPRTLDVRRVWSLEPGLRGSFTVIDARGRLGVGAYRPNLRGWLDWLDPAALVAGTGTAIGAADVLEHVVAPSHTQGAAWGRFGEGGPALWWTRSDTRCGILVGPSWRRGFVPGAEGMTPAGRHGIWVVSESGSRHYQQAGGRPVVPTLVRFDVSHVRSWERPECQV